MTAHGKVFYLNNKSLIEEIHRSKISYSSYLSPEYAAFDAVVKNKKFITEQFITKTREKKAKEIYQGKMAELKATGLKTQQIKIDQIDPLSIPVETLVFRVMEFDHIPLLAPEELKNIKSEKDKHIKVNFPPYAHYIIKDNQFIQVGRSHWKGDFNAGEFNQDHGKTTHKLALMYLSLVDRYGQKGNWRGYSYIEEMKCQALLQLSQRGLSFDESVSEIPNPFAYYTQLVKNAFTRVLNLEKKAQSMRDDMLLFMGATPSYTKQVEAEFAHHESNSPHKTRQSDLDLEE